MTWDVSTPTGSENRILGDDRIRELKTDIQTALRGDDTEGVEAVFPGGDTANPVYRYRGLKDTTANRPAAAHHGLFFDTTRNALQRSNGTTWDDVGTMIASGSILVFFQAAAPVGWTKLTTQNDKALRIVSGTGGGVGGTTGLSSYVNHTHTVQDHTLTVDEIPSHTHSLPAYDSVGGSSAVISDGNVIGTANTNATGGGDPHNHGATGSASSALAYIDVIAASKD